jgi:hypothetical protein
MKRSCSKETHVGRGSRYIHGFREHNRLTRVDTLGQSKFFQVAVNQVSDTLQNNTSFICRQSGPSCKRTGGSVNGNINVCRIGIGNPAVWFTDRRIIIFQVPTPSRGYEFSIYVIQYFFHTS